MEDRDIVELFLKRSSEAINKLIDKYERYCIVIAKNILGSYEDAEECFNDVCLKVWNSIPPSNPSNLKIYVARIARNTALDKYRYNKASKRFNGEIPLILDELSDCISNHENVEKSLEDKEVIEAINEFLGTLPKEKSDIFMRRYWYAEPVTDIAKRYDVGASSVTMTLKRLRVKLNEYLVEKGVV